MRILEGLHPDVDFANTGALVDNRVLDSYDIIMLVSEINFQLGVLIPAEEIIPENFNSAQAIWALIERLEDQ